MRRSVLILSTVLVAVVIVCGCKKEEPPTPAERVGKGIDEAVEATREYVEERHRRTVDQMEEELAELEQRTDRLKERARIEEAERREDFEEARAQLEEKIEDARDELARARRATGDVWEELKATARAALNDLEETYRQIVNQYDIDVEIKRE